MCRVRLAVGWVGAALLALAGCQSTEPSLRPPERPEEVRLPPREDSRFTLPIEYPKQSLNADLIKKSDPLMPGLPPMTQSPTTRFGAGGPGMGM